GARSSRRRGRTATFTPATTTFIPSANSQTAHHATDSQQHNVAGRGNTDRVAGGGRHPFSPAAGVAAPRDGLPDRGRFYPHRNPDRDRPDRAGHRPGGPRV